MSCGGEPMEQDNNHTIIDRFYFLLNAQLQAQLPRPGGIHKYSHGGLIAGYQTSRSVDSNGNVTWKITISKGINYGSYAMGFKDDGTKRTPRGPLEKINFSTIEKCCVSVAKCLAMPTGGKVDVLIR